jgi:hypothetical protein
MKYQIIILLVLAFLAQQSSCKKNCVNTTYNFDLPVKAYPDSDTIKVGDTIWIEINSSSNFIDKGTNKNINYSDASNLGSAIGFSIWDSLNKKWVDAANDFTFTLIKGSNTSSSNTNLFREYLFNEENDFYVFKLGITPQKKGLYSFLLSNSNNTYRRNDKCTKANFTIIFRNTNQHYYLSPFYTGQTNLEGGDYYFKVK